MTKALLLILALGWLYFRLVRRNRGEYRFCWDCGKRNPRHLARCLRCAAPLYPRDGASR